MPPVIDEAICIRQWDWSETSQTCALFTRGLGMVRALAKGSRRPKSPYSGGVEILTRGRIGLILRPNSDLALLTEWDLVEMFPALRAKLRIHNAGLYMADLIGHAIHDHDPHPALYDSMLESLRLLRGAEDVASALLKFQWSVLVETGYTPVLDANVRTGEAIAPARSYLFSPSLGGLSPDAAAEPEASASGGVDHERSSHAWRVRAGTIELLRGLAANGLTGVVEAAQSAGDNDAAAVDRANRLLASYVRYVLGAEPPTMGLVFGPRLPR
jgi:DNA repair protein RecO (recombination protein O)